MKNPVCRAAGLVVLAIGLAAALPGSGASAQNFFESLFGGFTRQRHYEPALPPRANSYADPSPSFHERPRYGDISSGSSGGAVAFCVRTCDGRYFPIQRHAGATPVETCRAFCPAAKTAVFSGSKIDYAVASNGTRYSDLDKAFEYRKRVVDNCTCNGKDPYGLAQVSVVADPTLRAGDIVATNDGLATYRGGRSRAASAEFTLITPRAGELGRKLSEIKVAPQPEKNEPTARDLSLRTGGIQR